MRLKYLAGIAVGVLMMAASAAQATVTITSTPGISNTPPSLANPLHISFDSSSDTLFTLNGEIAVLNASIVGVAAAPAGDLTNFLSSPYPDSSGSGTITWAPMLLSWLTIDWGSIDQYNLGKILGLDGAILASFTGAELPPGNGDQGSDATNRFVRFQFDAPTMVTGLEMGGNQYAFEIDNISGGVPEPATWALMILGFGGTGALLRRKRLASAVA